MHHSNGYSRGGRGGRGGYRRGDGYNRRGGPPGERGNRRGRGGFGGPPRGGRGGYGQQVCFYFSCFLLLAPSVIKIVHTSNSIFTVSYKAECSICDGQLLMIEFFRYQANLCQTRQTNYGQLHFLDYCVYLYGKYYCFELFQDQRHGGPSGRGSRGGPRGGPRGDRGGRRGGGPPQ